MHGTMPVYAQGVYVQRFLPPPIYAQWYASMERCAGLRGDFNRVTWLVTPLPWRDGNHGLDSTYGATWDHHILVNALEALDSVLVSHEALHDILSYHDIHNDASHPFPWFGPLGCANEFHERGGFR